MNDPKPDTAAKLDDPGDGFGPYPDRTPPFIKPKLPDYILDMGPNDYIFGWGGEPIGRKEAEEEFEMSAEELCERNDPFCGPPYNEPA